MPLTHPSSLADLIPTLARELGGFGEVRAQGPEGEIQLVILAGRESELAELKSLWGDVCRRSPCQHEGWRFSETGPGEVRHTGVRTDGAAVSLVVFPQRLEPGCSTAVISWHGPETEEYDLFSKLRSGASSGRVVYYDSTSNEMVTPEYVGPDRRKDDHQVRFLLRGKRQKNAPGLPQADYFSDRMMPQLRPFVMALMGLSLIDGLATCVWLVTGTAEEANPILGASLFGGLPLFLLAKAWITAALIGVLVFFQHFLFMRVIKPVTIAVYLALLAYHAHIWLASFPESV